MDSNILITICARGGSKGIPKKNIFLVNGKPLIAYTIDFAMEFKNHIDCDIILSTDDKMIKKVASEIDIGLIVGGGIRTPQMAKNIVEAGASHVVIGSAIEDSAAIAKEFSSAIHNN